MAEAVKDLTDPTRQSGGDPILSGIATEVQGELVRELDLMIRARYPLIYLVSPEEEPADAVLVQVAKRTDPPRRLLFWDVVRGWQDSGEDRGSIMAALGRVWRSAPQEDTLFVLRDLHFVLRNASSDKNAPILRELKNLSRELKRTRKTLILLSHILEVPSDLAEEITVVDIPLPNSEEISRLIQLYVAPEKLKLTPLAREQLVKACQGLSRERIRRVLARALAAKQEVNEADIDLVLEEKKQAIRQTGILEFFTARETLKSVGGLDNLKAWVRVRQEAFTEEARRYGIGGRQANQALGSQQVPRLGNRQIRLAQVHPIRLADQGQVHPVVDDHQRLVAVAHLPQLFEIPEHLPIGEVLAAVLHQRHPSPQRLFHHLQPVGHRAGDQVEMGRQQPLAQGSPQQLAF